jgi:hypothetical protein
MSLGGKMEPQGRILDGNLETLGLQATLKMLALGGKTGVLSVTSGHEYLAIYLENGHIVDLDEPGAPAPDLPDMFRLLGRIPRSRAAELRGLAGANPATAMAIMLQWGYLTPDEVQQRTEFRVIQAISRAVRWERGRFEFHLHISPIQPQMGQRTFNVDHILLEALRMADEWGRTGTLALTRGTVARWMPAFNGDVAQLNLGREEIGVLCLSNGQFPLHAIAYTLLVPESQVASVMQRLLDLGLIEVVDARLETELERSLVDLLTRSQHSLSQDARPSIEQRMVTLVRTMGACINGLLAHHGQYARVLRGRGEVPRTEVARYIEATFGPMLAQLQHEFPRMDEMVRLANGQVQYQDIESLDKVVRGQELGECYWDAVQLFSYLMPTVFERVLHDEVGKSRIGRQFEDLWAAFLREIDEDIARLAQRRAATRGQAERAARPGMMSRGEAAYAYDVAPDPRRRFS